MKRLLVLLEEAGFHVPRTSPLAQVRFGINQAFDTQHITGRMRDTIFTFLKQAAQHEKYHDHDLEAMYSELHAQLQPLPQSKKKLPNVMDPSEFPSFTAHQLPAPPPAPPPASPPAPPAPPAPQADPPPLSLPPPLLVGHQTHQWFQDQSGMMYFGTEPPQSMTVVNCGMVLDGVLVGI